MTIEIVPYAPEHRPLVRELNARLAAAGSRWSFYEDDRPDWLAREEGVPVWREQFVAVEDGAAVRGAYVLKSQEFLVEDKRVQLASWQGPVSEGDVDNRYAFLALQLLRDMQRREPLLYGWGATDRMEELLRRLHWRTVETPFLLRVVKPVRFLRRNAYLRRTQRDRALLDAAAMTGVGSIGIRALQTRVRRVRTRGAVVEKRFGPWADEVWEAAQGRYAFVADRSSRSLNALFPEHGWPEAEILRLPEGWAAVRDQQLQGDVRFGDLRLGSIVDAFGPPEAAPEVVAAAARHLARGGVDLVVANFSHPAWIAGFRAAGFVVVPNRRHFAVSPGLAKAYPKLDALVPGMHLTPIDGDGPRGL
jgi:hypothetical protein